SGISGPWLYSGVDQARASETMPIQNTGTEPRTRSANQKIPAVFRARAGAKGAVSWLCPETDMGRFLGVPAPAAAAADLWFRFYGQRREKATPHRRAMRQ